jgi:hypothetical protein
MYWCASCGSQYKQQLFPKIGVWFLLFWRSVISVRYGLYFIDWNLRRDIFFPINLCLALNVNYALSSLRDLLLFGIETYGPLQLYYSIFYTFFFSFWRFYKRKVEISFSIKEHTERKDYLHTVNKSIACVCLWQCRFQYNWLTVFTVTERFVWPSIRRSQRLFWKQRLAFLFLQKAGWPAEVLIFFQVGHSFVVSVTNITVLFGSLLPIICFLLSLTACSKLCMMEELFRVLWFVFRHET